MQQTFRITDEDGIHARPATALVNTANKFKGAESFAEANGKKVTLKSILGVLSSDWNKATLSASSLKAKAKLKLFKL